MDQLLELNIYHSVKAVLFKHDVKSLKAGTNVLAQEIVTAVSNEINGRLKIREQSNAETELSFKRGDVVRLKSGGIEFTVMRTLKDIDDDDTTVHITAFTPQGVLNSYVPTSIIEHSPSQMLKD